MPQQYDLLTFQVDHIIARKHHGADDLRESPLACYACNNHKGPKHCYLKWILKRARSSLVHPRQDLGRIISSGTMLCSLAVQQLAG